MGNNPGGLLLEQAQIIAEALRAKDNEQEIIKGDEVEFHDSPKIVLPQGMTFGKAFKILKRLEEEAETPTDFHRQYKYRSADGAYAALQVIKSRYGMLLGQVIDMGFFGKINAQTRVIAIGPGKTMQVPWGLVAIPTCPGLELYLTETVDKDYGKIFQIHGSGPRKFKDEVEEFFDDVDRYLASNSIYRGHALVGSNDLEFLDLDGFNPKQIVFSDEVTAILDGTVWAPIRHTETMRAEKVSLKRATLLHGPYGTGKTSIGQLTALVATENKWTFISAKPGRDKVEDVLRTARLYEPAVVFIEDIDGEASSGENQDVTKLLDAFDGITAKGGELMIVMTTNHIERIHKGMLRPGRLDAVVEIAGLDEHGVERLIRVVVGDKLDQSCDFAAVGKAMEGFLPAFVRETITRSVTFAINRANGSRDYVIGTDDLVNAAHSLQPQLDALNEAGEGEKRPPIQVALENTVKAAVKDLKFLDSYNDPYSPQDAE